MSAPPTAEIAAPAAVADQQAGQRTLPPQSSSHGLNRILFTQCVAALFPLAAAAMVFGWRAVVSVCIVVGSTVAAAWLWRRVGRRGAQLHLGGAAVLGLLLALMLPPHLLSGSSATPNSPTWPILPAAGITLAVLCWLLGGTLRVHPAVLAILLLSVLFHDQLEPRAILQPSWLLRGDLNLAIDAPPTDLQKPWLEMSHLPDAHAIARPSTASRLTTYTTGRGTSDRAWISMESLIRDRLPPLEDLIVAGDPSATGCASAVAVVVGGLFLLYRGLIDYRIPLLMVLSAWIALLVLPVPLTITDSGAKWAWLALRPSAATWAVGITFANYELLASPLLLCAFFLAPHPSMRPMKSALRPIYAIAAGVFAAVMQLYVDVSIGPYLGLLFAGMLTPLLEHVSATAR